MNKKSERTSFVPDTVFQVKEMGKRIKFILKLENLYQNREDSNGYTCAKIKDDNPFFSIKFNDASKCHHISKLLSSKYNYCTHIGDNGIDLVVTNKPMLDPLDLEIDIQIKEDIKNSFEGFEHELDEDPKLDILRRRYKKIIGAVRYHFPMSYGFNENSSNGYRSTRIKGSDDTFFHMQFTTSELTDNVSNFLLNNGYKVSRHNQNTIQVFLEDPINESEILKHLNQQEFSGEQLEIIWDMLNTNGLVLLDVNNQFNILDLFNGKGLTHVGKEQFIRIIKNQ